LLRACSCGVIVRAVKINGAQYVAVPTHDVRAIMLHVGTRSLGRSQSRRIHPRVNVRSCFSLPSPSQEQFPSHGAGALLFGRLSKSRGLYRKSLLES
jgi:hypothetical protein